VIFALERAALYRRRFDAYQQRDGYKSLPIAVVGKVIDLLNPKCVDIIVATVREAERHMGCAVGLIAFDSYSKGIAAGGGDEDKARDQNRVAANMRRIQEQFDVHIATVGHTGKDESRGERGSNARLGDIDVLIQITGDGSTKTAKVTEANDQLERVIAQFRLEPIELGVDANGNVITTSIIANTEITEPAVSAQKQKRKRRWSKALTTLRRALMVVLAEHGEVTRPFGMEGPELRAVDREDVRSEFYKIVVVNSDSKESEREAKKKAFSRSLKDAHDDELIGLREVNGSMLIWLVAPEDGASTADDGSITP
jgi:hypothetical protein